MSGLHGTTACLTTPASLTRLQAARPQSPMEGGVSDSSGTGIFNLCGLSGRGKAAVADLTCERVQWAREQGWRRSRPAEGRHDGMASQRTRRSNGPFVRSRLSHASGTVIVVVLSSLLCPRCRIPSLALHHCSHLHTHPPRHPSPTPRLAVHRSLAQHPWVLRPAN